jgi:leucyl aminopeptidase
MNYHFEPSANAATLHTDCVVVGIYKDAKMTAAAAQLDTASNGAIHNHLALGDFNGDKGRSVMLYQLAGVTAKRVLLVGMGEKDKLTLEVLAAATQTALEDERSSLVNRSAREES